MSVESCYSFFSWPPLHNKCISPKKSSHRSSSNSYSYFLQADSNRLPVQFLLQCRQRGPGSLSLSSSFHLALAFSKWALLSDSTHFYTCATAIKQAVNVCHQRRFNRTSKYDHGRSTTCTQPCWVTSDPVKHVTGKSRQQFYSLLFLSQKEHSESTKYMSHRPILAKKHM